MDDETKTVADYKLVENGFIVMMISKVSCYSLFLQTYDLLSSRLSEACNQECAFFVLWEYCSESIHKRTNPQRRKFFCSDDGTFSIFLSCFWLNDQSCFVFDTSHPCPSLLFPYRPSQSRSPRKLRLKRWPSQESPCLLRLSSPQRKPRPSPNPSHNLWLSLRPSLNQATMLEVCPLVSMKRHSTLSSLSLTSLVTCAS